MFFKTKHQTIYYEIHGNNPKYILILPGWGDTRKTFTNIINYLKNEYTIYILDYPGFGNSPYPNKDLTIFDYANIINLFIKSILLSKHKLKVDKIILIDVAGIKRRKKLKIIIKEIIYKLLKKLSIFLPRIKKEKYLNKLISVFSSNDYKTIWKKGDTIPAASEEMEAFYAFEKEQSEKDYQGWNLPEDQEEMDAHEKKWQELQAAVPEWH